MLLINSDPGNNVDNFKHYYVVVVNDPLMRIPAMFTVVSPSADEVRNCFRAKWFNAMRYNKDSFQVCDATFAEPKLYAKKISRQLLAARDAWEKNIPVEFLAPGGEFAVTDTQGNVLIFNDSMIQVMQLWTWVMEHRIDQSAVITCEDIPEGSTFPERGMGLTSTPLSRYDNITKTIL